MERVVLFAGPAEDPYDPGLRSAVMEPPLGLLYLAAALRRSGSCEAVKLVDAYRDPAEVGRLEETLREFGATQLWVSLMSQDGARCFGGLALRLRERLPHIRLVAGGKFFRNAPLEALRPGWNGFDAIVLGDADLEAERVLACSGVHRCAPLPFVELPYPRRDLVDIRDYAGTRPPHFCVIGARGCVGNCSFCALAQRRPYRRAPAAVALEIEQLIVETGVGCYSIIDDLMPFDPDRFACYTEALGRLPEWVRLDVSWRADRFTPETAAALAAARVRIVRFGIEAIDPDLQRLLGKPCSREQIRNAVRWARAEGLSAATYFMFGFPTDTEESVAELLDFMGELASETPVPPYLGVLRVLPGTGLERIYGPRPARGLPEERMLEVLAGWRRRFPDFFGAGA